MNFPVTYRRIVRVSALCGFVLTLVLLGGCSKPAAPPAAPAKPKADASKTNTVAKTASGTNQYVSVFDNFSQNKTKDPFNPSSHRLWKREDPTKPQQIPVDAQLILKAVIQTTKHSQAVINNAFLEVGEPFESVRLPSGAHARVKCVEIGPDYAVVQVEGEPETKRLTMVRKKN